MRAFLSHSSRDKEFVHAVANELGRQFATLDEQAFRNGEELKQSIAKHLEDASVFVLFASANSLDSMWVEFEAEEAWFQKLQSKLPKSLVYIIDNTVDFENIPEWLRKAKILSGVTSKKVIARDIRSHLNDLLSERQHSYMVGRSRDLSALEEALTPVDGSDSPRAIFVTGLPGIGRRSLIRRAVPDLLNLSRCVELRINEGDSTNDFCITVANHVEPYSTQEGFERIVNKIRDLSDEEALSRILTNLRSMVKTGELPLVFDEGGLLDSEGHLRQTIRSLLNELGPTDEAYIFFVSSRRPQFTLGVDIPIVRVRELRENDTKRLITILTSQDRLNLSQTQVAELAENVAGYPPAAYFAVEQVREYGADLVLSDARRLVQFRRTRFLQHLDTLHLDTEEQYILRLLALYSPLPMSVIVTVTNSEAGVTQDRLIRLIDLALVTTTQAGHYRIADPVVDAAVSAFGFPSTQENKSLARVVNDLLQESDTVDTRLDLSRVLFRAARLANDKVMEENAIYLASDLIKLTETLYHERRYREAVNNGYVAIDERPKSERARSYLIRALVQEESWEEAESQISELQRYAPVRNVLFLRGFLERKHNNIGPAIEAYESSKRAGRRDVAVNRELAQCYLLTNDLE